MDWMGSSALTAGVIGYSVAVTLFIVDLARSDLLPANLRWGPRMLAVGAVFHLVHMTRISWVTRSCPVGSVHFALSLAGLIAVSGYLVLRRRPSLHAIGIVVAPLALTFLLVSEYVGTARPSVTVSRGLLAAHVSANLLGLSMLLLAATASVFYLIEERRLRHKRRVSRLGRLPPLDTLDRTSFRLMVLGFPLLTVGLATGAGFATSGQSTTLAGMVRVGLSYLTWALVGAALALRVGAGWRGHRAACGAILSGLCLLLVVALYVAIPSVGAAP